MALIGEIRKRSGLLAVVIGLALVLFLVSDIFSNQNFSFGKQDDTNPTVLKVGGKEVSRQQFDMMVLKSEEVRKLNGMSVDDNMRKQLRTEAANQLFNDMAVAPLLENLGIEISGKEYGELITGETPHPFIMQYFQQQYSPETMRNFLANQYQNDPKYKVAMDEIIRAIKTQVKAEKYNSLVRAGFQATPFDAEMGYTKAETKVSGQLVFANYLSVADSLVKVSDNEMRSFINEHKEDYEVEDSRDIEYLEWAVKPNSNDSGDVFEQVKNLKEDFAAAANDSVFISKNSDLDYNIVFRSHGSFGGEAETKLFNANVGDVVGPIGGDGGFGVYKILGKKSGGKMYYNFSQIVLARSADTAAINARVSQLLAEINNGTSFESLAASNSIDPSSQNGGNMGWVTAAAYIPTKVIQYNENNAPGSLGVIVDAGGVRIVRVNARPSDAMVQVASIVRKVKISRGTKNEAFAIANNFVAELDAEDEFGFSKKASELKMNVKNGSKLAPGAEGWSSLPNAREVIKWAYESQREVGDVSGPFSIQDKVIVARVRKIVKKGVADLDAVRDEVKLKVINQKKAKILTEKFAEASKKNEGKPNAVSLAIAIGTVAQKIENAQFSQNSILYVGNDSKVQGAILGLQKGDVSKPIVGDQGVYVFFCEDVTSPPVAPEMEGEVAKIMSGYRQGIESKIDQVLKDKSGLENMFDKYY